MFKKGDIVILNEKEYYFHALVLEDQIDPRYFSSKVIEVITCPVSPYDITVGQEFNRWDPSYFKILTTSQEDDRRDRMDTLSDNLDKLIAACTTKENGISEK